MTTTSREKIMCECGHEGYVKLRENDQPFSSLWESYSLEGFDGGSFTETRDNKMTQGVLETLKPKCPKCGKVGKAHYIKN